MANGVDPDEKAHELSHLDLHCLHGYLFWSTRLKGFVYLLSFLFARIISNCSLLFC